MISKCIFALMFGLALNFSVFAEEKSVAYLMTTSSSTFNVSTLHIINTHSTNQDFVATLYQNDGSQLGDSRVQLNLSSIPANGRLVLTSLDLEGIFNVAPWSGPAMLEVFAPNEFKLMIKLKGPSGAISNSNCVTEGAVFNIDGFEIADLTFIRFINTGTTPIVGITGNLYDQFGNNIGSSNVMLLASLAPKEQRWINKNQLAVFFDGEWQGEASLVVNDHSDLKLLNLNWPNRGTFFNFSCFESSSISQDPPVALSEIQSTIFTPNCAFSGCHGGASPVLGLNLEPGQTFSNTVGVTSSQNSSLKLIQPSDPDNSYLIRKLEGTGSGSTMPKGASPLSSEDIDSVRSWVSAGALDN